MRMIETEAFMRLSASRWLRQDPLARGKLIVDDGGLPDIAIL